MTEKTEQVRRHLEVRKHGLGTWGGKDVLAGDKVQTKRRSLAVHMGKSRKREHGTQTVGLGEKKKKRRTRMGKKKMDK